MTGDPVPAPRLRQLRWLLAVAAGVAAIPVAVWLTRSADVLGPVAELRERLRGSAFGVLAWYGAAVLLGALAQAPLAAMRRARLATGLLAVAGLLAVGTVVALVAVALEPHVPLPRNTAARTDTANWFPYGLFLIVAGYAFTALSGLVFWGGRRADRRPKGRNTAEPVIQSLGDLLVFVSAVPAAFGWAALAGLAMHAAARADLPWAPANGQPLLIGGTVLAVLQGLMLLTIIALTPSAAGRNRQNPVTLLSAALTFAVSLAGAQLGHITHVAVVAVLAVIVLPTLLPLSLGTMQWLTGRVDAWRIQRGPEGNDASSAP